METTRSKILACIDGSRYSAAVCDYAAWISLKTGAPLTLLHNIEHQSNSSVSDLSGAIGLGSRESLLSQLTELEAHRSRLMLEQGKLMLAAARKRVVQAGVADPVVKQRHDGLTESLIELEDEIRILVLGIRGEQYERDNDHLGAHLESSIRALHRPILVVNNDFNEPRQIMLAYDGSEASGKALSLVALSPLFKGLAIHLVTVGMDPSSGASLQQSAVELLQNSGHEVSATVLDGKPSEALHRYHADHAIDLTLMGAFSHTRLRELVLGSFTVKMLLGVSKPLLLLR